MTRHHFTIGTHNTLDGAGTATPFADLIFFTEAIPRKVKAQLRRHGYGFRVCTAQRDLVIAYRKSVFTFNRLGRYRLVHKGVRKVTPHRGTYRCRGKHNATGRRILAEIDHRINAAFEPFIRGEGPFRHARWLEHTAVSKRIAIRAIAHELTVLYGGDPNCPGGVSAFGGVLEERAADVQRIAVSRDAELGPAEVLDKAGSDHHRLRATVTL